MSGSAFGHRLLVCPETQGSRPGQLPVRDGPPGGATPSHPCWAELPAGREAPATLRQPGLAPSSAHLEGTSAAAAPPARAEVLLHTPTQLLTVSRGATMLGASVQVKARAGAGVLSFPRRAPRHPLVPLLRTVPVAPANHERAREIRTLLRESLVRSHVARQAKNKNKKMRWLIAMQDWAGRGLVPHSLVGALFSVFPFWSQVLPFTA